MKKSILILIYLWGLYPYVFSQTKSDATATVIQQQDINFSYQNIEEMSVDKILQNAILLRTPSNRTYSKVYCALQLNGNPYNASFPQLYLQQSNTKNPAILLTTTPQLVYSYMANGSPNEVFFDIKIPRQLKWTPTGNYNFTLVFSSLP